MRFFLIFIVSLFLLSCSGEGGDSLSTDSTLTFRTIVDTILFEKYTKRYPRWYDYEQNELVLVNVWDTAIDFYDLSSKKITKSIDIEKKYWDYVYTASDELLVFTGTDLIFYYDSLYDYNGFIVLLNLEDGTIKKRFPITSDGENDIYLSFNKQFLPYLNFEQNKIYTKCFDFRDFEKKSHPLDTELLGEYDMITGEKKVIPFKYPEILTKLNLCGYQLEEYACVRGDSIIITYSACPNIDVYEVRNQNLTRLVVNHAHYDSLAGNSPEVMENFDLCTQGALTEFFFGPIKYNPAQDRFYRTYRDKMHLMRPDSTYNTERDKPFGIQVLDAQFNVLGDFPIGYLYPHDELFEMYPTSSGLMYTSHGITNDTLFINYLNFDYE